MSGELSIGGERCIGRSPLVVSSDSDGVEGLQFEKMRTFRPRKSYGRTAALFLLGFAAVGAGSAYFAWTEALQDRRIGSVALFSTFWGAWVCFSLWLLLVYFRSNLMIEGHTIFWRGVVTQKEFDLASTTTARWASGSTDRIQLASPTCRIDIGFDLFEPAERLWLVRFLRGHLPEAIQDGWGRFCYRRALPLRDPPPPIPDPLPSDRVVLTRKRWDCYFFPFTVLCAVIGMACYMFTKQVQALAPLFFPVPLWLFLRFTTPKQGVALPRMGAEAGEKRMLLFLLLWTLLALGGITVFKTFDLPKPQAYVAGTVASLTWFGGLLWRARRADRELQRWRLQQELPKIEEAIRRWDEGEKGFAHAAEG